MGVFFRLYQYQTLIYRFFRLYNNIQPASGLTWGSDFYLFREGIKPMWEHPDNVKGGRWLTVIERTKRAERLDVCWLELMMALLGEQFDDMGSEICGAAVNVRQKGDKVRDSILQRYGYMFCRFQIALWTRDSSKDDVNLAIGHIMREKLLMSDNEQIKYEVHKDASARNCSVIKPKLALPPQVTKAPKQSSSNQAATASNNQPVAT